MPSISWKTVHNQNQNQNQKYFISPEGISVTRALPNHRVVNSIQSVVLGAVTSHQRLTSK